VSEAPRKDWKYGLIGCEVRGHMRLFILARPRRSKWWRLTCFCKRVRKNGTCQRSDVMLAGIVKPERRYIRVEHSTDETKPAAEHPEARGAP
jgi:hypothetical protein